MPKSAINWATIGRLLVLNRIESGSQTFVAMMQASAAFESQGLWPTRIPLAPGESSGIRLQRTKPASFNHSSYSVQV
jgi:hypothetical protein